MTQHCQNFSSRMAAVDYSICAQSEVFVTTQGGNFPHFLMGHRRYLYGGHSKTIKPDKRRLAVLFNNPRIGYDNTTCPSSFKHLTILFVKITIFIHPQVDGIEAALA